MHVLAQTSLFWINLHLISDSPPAENGWRGSYTASKLFIAFIFYLFKEPMKQNWGIWAYLSIFRPWILPWHARKCFAPGARIYGPWRKLRDWRLTINPFDITLNIESREASQVWWLDFVFFSQIARSRHSGPDSLFLILLVTELSFEASHWPLMFAIS